MKMLAQIAMTAMLFAGSTRAQDENQVEVVRVLLDETNTYTLEIEADTFIPNIQGYACPVPAINIPRYFMYNARLRPTRNLDFGVKEEALSIKNPNMRFCRGMPTAQTVFGEAFKIGKNLPLKLRFLREIVEFVDHEGKTQTMLRESVTTHFLGQDLVSHGEVLL